MPSKKSWCDIQSLIRKHHAEGGAFSVNTLNHHDAIIISNTLELTDGALNLNSNTITLTNSSPSAITRNQGFILSEQTDNSGKLAWNIGSTTGAHVYPFGTPAGTYIPFTLDLTAGNIGSVAVSTYPTADDNTPYPVTPVLVSHVNNAEGNDNSHDIVNRFWQVDKDGPSGTATMTFSARRSEVDGLHTLRMKRWNSNTQNWDVPLPEQTTTETTVTVQNVTNFSPWMMQGSQARDFPLNSSALMRLYVTIKLTSTG